MRRPPPSCGLPTRRAAPPAQRHPRKVEVVGEPFRHDVPHEGRLAAARRSLDQQRRATCPVEHHAHHRRDARQVRVEDEEGAQLRAALEEASADSSNRFECTKELLGPRLKPCVRLLKS